MTIDSIGFADYPTLPDLSDPDDGAAIHFHYNPDGTCDTAPTASLHDLATLSDMDAERDWQAVVDGFAREVYGDRAL